MKKLKSIIASASAAVMAASAMLAAVPAYAAAVEKEIEYTGPSDGALAFENDGSSLRMNIFNEWGTNIKDINNKGNFSEKISVTFTVNGIGDNSANVAEDGTETPYEAYLSGSVGTDSYWGATAEGNTVDNKAVAIDGDGTYTSEFLLSGPADTISCLIISTNINAYQYADSDAIDTIGASATGITFNIDKITTMSEETEPDPDVLVGTIGTAALIGNIGATGVWGADEITEGSKTADIDGDAQYEVVWNVTDGGTDTLEFLAVQIPGLTSDKYENLAVKVDGVYIDGKPVENYKTSEAAIDLNYLEGTGATRIYLIDEWAGTGVADIASDTAITQSLKVVFTVSGTGKDGTSNVSKYPKGDITRDGVVDLYDAIEISKYLIHMVDIDEEQKVVGDINDDGVVDLYDAIEIARSLLPKH